MNEELTNEVLKAVTKCNETKCRECAANDYCSKYNETMASIATALLEERAKQKLWGDAPKEAVEAFVTWYEKGGVAGVNCRYTRELPKTRAREIAEQEGHGLAEKYGWNDAAKELVTNVMESALNKYAKELEQ